MEKSIEAQVGELLRRHGLTLGLGESCTGGLLGDRITNVPGSSDYFRGGVVAYSNQAKARLLGVRQTTLQDQGAVSKATALEMARGVRTLLGTDVAIAITGIAGPGGALPGKPVGLTWIALCGPSKESAEEFTWKGGRVSNKRQSAQTALKILLNYLKGLPEVGGTKAGSVRNAGGARGPDGEAEAGGSLLRR